MPNPENLSLSLSSLLCSFLPSAVLKQDSDAGWVLIVQEAKGETFLTLSKKKKKKKKQKTKEYWRIDDYVNVGEL